MWDNAVGQKPSKLLQFLRGDGYKNGWKSLLLYRVSTAKQVDHDEQNQADIPMQRKACHEFAERMSWTIVQEEQETGISGYKVSAADRDKIQLIREHAEKDKFDILLVFMFDRIGRKAEETPFVVEWFLQYSGLSFQESIR